MNEKWFNYAISLTIMMIFVNAFITIGASQLNADGSSNLFLMNSTNNALTYEQQKQNSGFNIAPNSSDSSQSATTEQGFTPITRTTDSAPVGLNALSALTTMAIGIELVMLQLAQIFWPVAALFYSIAGVAFLIKAIAAAWLGSIAVRAIFGRVV